MTLRRTSQIWTLSFLFLVGCTSDLLEQSIKDIDAIATQIDSGPIADRGEPLGPAELLSAAERGGAEYLKVRLDAQRAQLQLDESKSGLLPRLSLSLRRQSSFTGGAFNNSTTDGSLFVDWDVAAALLYGGRKNIEISEQILPVQTALAENAAAMNLFEAYGKHEAARFAVQQLRLDQKLAQCRTNQVRVEFELGNTNKSEIAAMQTIETSIAKQVVAADLQLDTSRRDVLYLAGIADTARLKAWQDPSVLFAKAPHNIERAECYSRSGQVKRDALLLKGATANVDAARLQQYGEFDLFLPSAISPDRGLTLDILISVLVPLVDQGDGKRRVQNARLALLNLALSSQKSQRQFDNQLSNVANALAKARTEIAQVERILAAQQTRPSPEVIDCEAQVALAESKLDLRRARLAFSQAMTRAALLCAPFQTRTLSTE